MPTYMDQYQNDVEYSILHQQHETAGGSPRADIRIHTCINGSGPQAFNGAKRWPAVTARVSFPVDASSNQVQAFVNDLTDLLVKHGYHR